MGDMNEKCRREPQYIPINGKESLHEYCNNELRLVLFVVCNSMTVSNITLTKQCGNHQTTDRKTKLIIVIVDYRSYRGADCDTEHFLLIAKFKIKLKSPEK